MKKLFVLLYFSMTKSTKSHLRGLSSLLKIFFRVHELVARVMRGECVRQMAKRKSVVLRSSQPHTTTRANISHEKAEQIRARIVCTPAEKRGAGVAVVRALTKSGHFASLLQWGIDRFAEQTRSASPRLGQKVAAVG